MLTSSFVSQLIIFNVKEEEQQVRAAKVMRPKRPTMETTDNHQSRSIGDMHSFLNANNNQQYNLLPFAGGRHPLNLAADHSNPPSPTFWMFPMLPKMISESCQELRQQQIKIFAA
jgi:hypothetical protein